MGRNEVSIVSKLKNSRTHLFVINVNIEGIGVYQVGFLLLAPVAGNIPEK